MRTNLRQLEPHAPVLSIKEMKRFLLCAALFVVSAAVLFGISLFRAFRRISEGHATGTGFVLGSPAENLVRLTILVLLAVLSYWISGKFVHN